MPRVTPFHRHGGQGYMRGGTRARSGFGAVRQRLFGSRRGRAVSSGSGSISRSTLTSRRRGGKMALHDKIMNALVPMAILKSNYKVVVDHSTNVNQPCSEQHYTCFQGDEVRSFFRSNTYPFGQQASIPFPLADTAQRSWGATDDITRKFLFKGSKTNYNFSNTCSVSILYEFYVITNKINLPYSGVDVSAGYAPTSFQDWMSDQNSAGSIGFDQQPWINGTGVGIGATAPNTTQWSAKPTNDVTTLTCFKAWWKVLKKVSFVLQPGQSKLIRINNMQNKVMTGQQIGAYKSPANLGQYIYVKTRSQLVGSSLNATDVCYTDIQYMLMVDVELQMKQLLMSCKSFVYDTSTFTAVAAAQAEAINEDTGARAAYTEL